MEPWKLIGMKYRLGSSPEKHGTADCLSLASAIVKYYGFEAPSPRREWYRRLRKGDYEVFKEELERWGKLTNTPRIGTVALCQANDNAYGLAAWYEDGWMNFAESEVKWFPIGGLVVVGCYFPLKPNSATPSG